MYPAKTEAVQSVFSNTSASKQYSLNRANDTSVGRGRESHIHQFQKIIRAERKADRRDTPVRAAKEERNKGLALVHVWQKRRGVCCK